MGSRYGFNRVLAGSIYNYVENIGYFLGVDRDLIGSLLGAYINIGRSCGVRIGIIEVIYGP